MRREYNARISPKANKSLDRRARMVFFQRSMIAIAMIILVSLAILLGSGIKAFAGSSFHHQPGNKYYTSIRIEQGDTLWQIAEEYTAGTDISAEDFIEEVCQLNHINGQNIHAGEYLVVSYYSTEVK